MGIGAEPLDDNGRPIVGWDSSNHRPAVPQITSTSVDPAGVVYGTMNVNATVPAVANQRVSAQVGDFVDGAIATIGAQSDTSALSDTGTFSLIALFKRALTKLTSIVTNTGNIPAQGQAAMAASLPVAIANNQSAIPANIQAQGTALNADGSGNLKVVHQGSVSITQPTSATSALSSVGASTTAGGVQLLASNTNRKAMYIYNDSTAILYLAFNTSASTTAYTVQVPANGFFEMPTSPIYTGTIFGIWSAVNGNARITELT